VTRNLDAGVLLERFLVAAIGAILAIRAFLHLTGYPKLGGEGLHIAHMLWGGLLMLAALALRLAYLGPRVPSRAAVLAGIGFGTFLVALEYMIAEEQHAAGTRRVADAA
jgi:hypothetical protein